MYSSEYNKTEEHFPYKQQSTKHSWKKRFLLSPSYMCRCRCVNVIVIQKKAAAAPLRFEILSSEHTGNTITGIPIYYFAHPTSWVDSELPLHAVQLTSSNASPPTRRETRRTRTKKRQIQKEKWEQKMDDSREGGGQGTKRSVRITSNYIFAFAFQVARYRRTSWSVFSQISFVLFVCCSGTALAVLVQALCIMPAPGQMLTYLLSYLNNRQTFIILYYTTVYYY